MRYIIGFTLAACVAAAACSALRDSQPLPPTPTTQVAAAQPAAPITASIENVYGGGVTWYVNSYCGSPSPMFPRGGGLSAHHPVRIVQVRGCDKAVWVVVGTIRLAQDCFFQVMPAFAVTFTGSEAVCTVKQNNASDASFTWSLRR